MHRSATRTCWLDVMLQFVSRMDPQLGCVLELTLFAAALLFAPPPGHARLFEKGFRPSSSPVRAPSRLMAR